MPTNYARRFAAPPEPTLSDALASIAEGIMRGEFATGDCATVYRAMGTILALHADHMAATAETRDAGTWIARRAGDAITALTALADAEDADAAGRSDT